MNAIVGITGASGFIGSNLVEYLSEQGFEVYSLQRQPSTALNYIKYELENEINEVQLNNVDIIIHTAVLHYSVKNKKANQVNYKAAQRIIEFAKKKNKRVIFLSTMSAHTDAKSNYGKNKLELEELFTKAGHCVLKLGLVLGKNGGLFQTIVETMKKTPIVPLLGKGLQPIQTIYINDVCEITRNIIINKITGTYNVAHPICFPIKDMYSKIGERINKKPTFIKVPFFMMYYPIKIAEAISVSLPISSESVLGLEQLKCFETQNDLGKLNVTPLNFEQTLDRLFTNAA